MHVTMRARRDLWSLRGRLFPSVKACVARATHAGFRVVQFSVQRDHVHLIVEGADRQRVMRGVTGLAVRVAKAVNRAMRRRGSVWDDRYHARSLKTPREVRNALAYVLLNWRKHIRDARAGVDRCSSAPWFTGWRDLRLTAVPVEESPVAAPHTWLASVGWRRHGLLRVDEAPS